MKYFHVAWLGVALGISGILITDWRWWLIVIPTIILVVIFNKEKK